MTAGGVLGGDIKVEVGWHFGVAAEQDVLGVANCWSLCSLLAARPAFSMSTRSSLGCRRLGMVKIVMLSELHGVIVHDKSAK